MSAHEQQLAAHWAHSTFVSDFSVALFIAPPLLLDCLHGQLLGAGVDVIIASSCGRDARATVIGLGPALTVVSLRLPPLGGLHVIGTLSDARADLRVLALLDSSSADEADRSLQAGAMSWMSTAHGWVACLGTVRAAAAGDVLFSGDLSGRQIHGEGKVVLSRREQQVLNLVYHGRSVKQIADDLMISRKTVKHHLAAVHTKFGVHNRTEAVLRAIDDGLVGPSGNPSDPGLSERANQASGSSAGGAPSPFSP